MATRDQEYPMRNPNKAKLFAFLNPEATFVALVGPEEARSPSFSFKRAALGVSFSNSFSIYIFEKIPFLGGGQFLI